MSRAHRRLLRSTNAAALPFRRAGFTWSRSKIVACDCDRRGAAFWGAHARVLPTRCLSKGYAGPLRGVEKVGGFRALRPR